MADRPIAADVEHLAVAGVAGARAKERVCRVVHVHEVAHLRAVAVNLDGLVLDGETDEPGDESLTIVLDQLPRPVDVRQPQRAGADAEHVVVDEMIVLACGLVDAVDVGRPYQVLLGDRQRIGPAVHLARAGKHHLHLRIVIAARFEHGELAPAIDFQIGVRIAKTVDMTDLARKVEDHVATADQMIHGRLLADVGDVHAHAIGDAVDVEQVAAVVGDQRVHEQYVGAEIDEMPRQIAADEPEAAGNHDRPAAIEIPVIRRHGR